MADRPDLSRPSPLSLAGAGRNSGVTVSDHLSEHATRRAAMNVPHTVSAARLAEQGRLLSLAGQVAIVTGGAMGIGRGIVTRLAEAGASVVIADVDEAGATTAKELLENGLDVLAVRCDVTNEADVENLVAVTVAWREGIDILVNNAGIYPFAPVLDLATTVFSRVIDINLKGAYLCTRHVAAQMVSQGRGGRIINITSVDALHPSSIGLAAYDASKHGLWGFTKNLALELAPHRIWVNAIAPGAIATPGVEHANANAGVDPDEVVKAFVARVPMARMGDPDDIAKVALFLAGDLATYLTGSQIVVDGGVLLSQKEP